MIGRILVAVSVLIGLIACTLMCTLLEEGSKLSKAISSIQLGLGTTLLLLSLTEAILAA